MNLCKYNTMLGKPNEGMHAHRLFGIAIVDVIMTIVGGCIISYITKKSPILVIIILFICGIILHRIFCVKTTVDKLLFSI